MDSKSDRVYWVDAAKALGIFLVYYGHVVEKLFRVGNEFAFTQLKFIYAFHMLFFFFLSGFFFKRRYSSKREELKTLTLKRIIPVLFFGIMLLPIWPIYLYAKYGYVNGSIITNHIFAYAQGQPNLNGITWFLICLFIAEIVAVVILRKINKVFFGIIIASIFLRFGLLITSNMKEAEISLGILRNTWYIYEGLVAFGFYALGYSTYKHLKSILSVHGRQTPCNASLLSQHHDTNFEFEYSLRRLYRRDESILSWGQQPFSNYIFSGHLFPAAILDLRPKIQAISFIGRNTLILIGTNGFFHTFVNSHLAARFNYLDSAIWITLFSLFISFASIILSIPVIMLSNKYLPQLVGKPYQHGPWLPDLSTIKLTWLKKISTPFFQSRHDQ